MQRFESVAHSHDAAYVVSSDWKLLRVNDGWRRFALENNGQQVLDRWGVGSSIEGVMGPALWAFYRDAFAGVHATRQHWEHDYECSSFELYRRLHMVVYPLGPGEVLVVTSPLVERPHNHEVVFASAKAYERRGVIAICSHCRRVCNPKLEGAWDWVPDFVRHPPRNLSHGLCPSCLTFYYPE